MQVVDDDDTCRKGLSLSPDLGYISLSVSTAEDTGVCVYIQSSVHVYIKAPCPVHSRLRTVPLALYSGTVWQAGPRFTVFISTGHSVSGLTSSVDGLGLSNLQWMSFLRMYPGSEMRL